MKKVLQIVLKVLPWLLAPVSFVGGLIFGKATSKNSHDESENVEETDVEIDTDDDDTTGDDLV